MNKVSDERLIKEIKKSQVWSMTCLMLFLFCSMLFVFYMWTMAAFGAVIFLVMTNFWLLIKQTSVIRLEIRGR